MIVVLFAVCVCAILLDSHLDQPTVLVLGGLAALYVTQVARCLLGHVRFVRALRAHASEGELGGVPVKYVSGVAPFVAGILRPRVYCDPGLTRELTSLQQRAVALHERHHLQRRDPLRLQLSRALRPLATFAPGLRAHLDAYEVRYEVAADKYALRHGATPADIAGALLAMLEHDRLRLAPGFIAVAEIRLRALRNDASVVPDSTKGVIATLGLAASAIMACIVFL